MTFKKFRRYLLLVVSVFDYIQVLIASPMLFAKASSFAYLVKKTRKGRSNALCKTFARLGGGPSLVGSREDKVNP